MDSQELREKLAQWYVALSARDFAALSAILEETCNPDMVLEYPQSGETFRGRANILAMTENYPDLPDATLGSVHGAEDKWVLTPSWTPFRITGSGDHYTARGRLAYPNGEVWSYVDLFELRDGKVIKLVEYFAAPFPAAEWRAKWVEKVDSTTR